MLSLSFLTTSLLFSTFQQSFASSFTTISPRRFAAPSPNVASANVLEMTKRNGSTRSSKVLQVIRKGLSNFGSAQLTTLEQGQEFSVSIQFGPQSFDVIMDTGSSDTWVAASNFQCVDIFTGEPTDQIECGFGDELYFIDATFSEFPNENFNITYGDGEFLSGCMGNETVTLAGITVSRQEVAAVNLAGWYGDDFTSGLLGLAYPGITSAYAGDNPTADNITDNLQYNPIFTNMYQRQLVAPLFSIAINRGSAQGPGGYLALGGTPPVAFNPVFASTPIQIFVAEAGAPSQFQGLTYYTITPDSVVYGNINATNNATAHYHRPLVRPSKATPAIATPFQAIVDSGTTLTYLPTALANSINAAFTPPATFDFFEGAYVVACNATVPPVGIQIGGHVFNIDPRDLVLDDGTGDNVCISGINDAGFSGLAILGDVFLKNVVAVFDVGAGEMRFAARDY